MRPIENVLCAAGAFFLALPARAFVTQLPPSLAPEVLSETIPTALTVFGLSTEDFSVRWEGPAPAGVEIRLVPGSLQWVRVADVLRIPRARLGVYVERAGAAGSPGSVRSAGFSQPFECLDKGLRAELPVALLSGEGNPIEIAFQLDGREVRARAVLRFEPRAELGPARVFYDPSCSRFGLEASGSAQSAQAHGWAYVGCRLVEVRGAGHRTTSLEAWVYWDGVGQSVRIGGVETPSSSVSVWPLRLRSVPGEVRLAAPDGDELILRYHVGERFHFASLGMGLGPYQDSFAGNGENTRTFAPALTLYGSLTFTESLRVVAFDDTMLDEHLSTDFGLYLHMEYFRFLDSRIMVNLLLGAHVIGFRTQGDYFLDVGVPQGIEATVFDAFRRGCAFTTGLFVYPLIDGKSYYNIWARWGSSAVFGELNFISWDEQAAGQPVHSDTVGVSVGFPVAQFL